MLERERDADVDLLSLQVAENGLQRLSSQRNVIASPRSQFFDSLEVRIILNTKDEPTVVFVGVVEQLEVAKAQIKEDEDISYPLAGE